VSRRTCAGQARWDRFERLLTCGIAHRNEARAVWWDAKARDLLKRLTVPSEPLRDLAAGHEGGIFNGPRILPSPVRTAGVRS
jgi:hypothetical protein